MRRSSVIKSSKGKVVGKAKICVCKVGRIESLDPLNFAIFLVSTSIRSEENRMG